MVSKIVSCFSTGMPVPVSRTAKKRWKLFPYENFFSVVAHSPKWPAVIGSYGAFSEAAEGCFLLFEAGGCKSFGEW